MVVTLRAWISAVLLTLICASLLKASDAKNGFYIDVPVPLGGQSAADLLAQLDRLSESAPADGRLNVVMRYRADSSGGEATPFEDALKLARAITSDRLRALRIVSLIEGEITGHSILPVLASDTVLFPIHPSDVPLLI